MTSLSPAVRDSTTMLRRDIKHSLRVPAMTLSGLGTPAIMLTLFNDFYVGAIGAGLGCVAHDIPEINYLAPAIIIMATARGAPRRRCTPAPRRRPCPSLSIFLAAMWS
jgi:ABC-2 type transport system permease protein